MARFCLHITGAPYTSGAPFSALRFAQAALQQGHQLVSVFLSLDGVYLASDRLCPPQDELNLRDAWQTLAQTHALCLQVCVAASLKRGILSEAEAQRHGLQQGNLAPGFELTGMGQLVDALHQSDRCLTFSG